MNKYADFDVPPEVLEGFIAEVIANDLAASIAKTKKSGEYIVSVSYDKGQENEIDSLEAYLDQLIEEAEQDDEDEDEEQDED